MTTLAATAYLASGYAAAGLRGFMKFYHGFTGYLRPAMTVGNAAGGMLIGYYHGRKDRKHSIPVSILRGAAYAPMCAFLGYGLAPAIMPVACAGLIIYLKGDMTIEWDQKSGRIKKFETKGVAE